MTCAWVSSGERFHLHACLILGGEQAALNNRLCFLSSSSPHLPSDLAVLHFSVTVFGSLVILPRLLLTFCKHGGKDRDRWPLRLKFFS